MDKEITYTVKWSEEDGEWVATCDKDPYLSALSTSPVIALADLISTVMRGE